MTQIFVLIEHLRGQVSDISHTMLAAAREAANAAGGQTSAILIGHQAEGLAETLDADQVLHLDHPQLAEFDPWLYQQAVDHILADHTPNLLLLGHTTTGMDLASGLSARHGWPIASQVRQLTHTGDGLGFTSQICGGKLLAQGLFGPSTNIATMMPGGYKAEGVKSTPSIDQLEPPAFEPSPVRFVEYIEPEPGEVDISQFDVLVAVGRGIGRGDEIELAEELAQALGGTVCASRPVVDQGWLSIARLVGKSGRSVKPRLYLALGISGAPEHMEAIADPQSVIAINSDPNAPIFNQARYGCVADLFDVIPSLVEKLETAQVA
jgi:electron transfer flavoprotein alpha subunit